MKTKILVAMIACLALGACTKPEDGSRDKAGADQTQGSEKTEPSQQPTTPGSGPTGTQGQSMNEPTSTLAADDAAQQAAQQNAQPSDNPNATDARQDAANNMQISNVQNQNPSYSQDQSNADQQSQPED